MNIISNAALDGSLDNIDTPLDSEVKPVPPLFMRFDSNPSNMEKRFKYCNKPISTKKIKIYLAFIINIFLNLYLEFRIAKKTKRTFKYAAKLLMLSVIFSVLKLAYIAEIVSIKMTTNDLESIDFLSPMTIIAKISPHGNISAFVSENVIDGKKTNGAINLAKIMIKPFLLNKYPTHKYN
ncbi:hypothetical protein V5G98_13840 [Vibrio cholerae]|uniref:hypothetical protein n=2 Tax=Vibrionaceae TaxID=641 RepID=UPI001A2518A9|nr:hypothetical protein [Vibrio cholerae]HAS3874405.1 hypothetical protein [Vibrio cholerae]